MFRIRTNRTGAGPDTNRQGRGRDATKAPPEAPKMTLTTRDRPRTDAAGGVVLLTAVVKLWPTVRHAPVERLHRRTTRLAPRKKPSLGKLRDIAATVPAKEKK